MKKTNKKKIALDLEILELEAKVAPSIATKNLCDDVNGAEC